jgi:hypothetical protein
MTPPNNQKTKDTATPPALFYPQTEAIYSLISTSPRRYQFRQNANEVIHSHGRTRLV